MAIILFLEGLLLSQRVQFSIQGQRFILSSSFKTYCAKATYVRFMIDPGGTLSVLESVP